LGREDFRIVFAVIGVVAGLISLLAPRVVFFLQEGWKFEDVEPSEAFLLVTRLGGLLAICLGIAVGAGLLGP